jgi:hypothetical protein
MSALKLEDMQVANPYPSPSPLARHRAELVVGRKDAETAFAKPPEWQFQPLCNQFAPCYWARLRIDATMHNCC